MSRTARGDVEIAVQIREIETRRRWLIGFIFWPYNPLGKKSLDEFNRTLNGGKTAPGLQPVPCPCVHWGSWLQSTILITRNWNECSKQVFQHTVLSANFDRGLFTHTNIYTYIQHIYTCIPWIHYCVLKTAWF